MVMIFTTGCWDKVEIEQRAFIGALTIDVNKKQEGQGRPGEVVYCEDVPDELTVNYGIVVPSQLAQGGDAFVTREIKGADLPDAMEKLSQRTSRRPFYAHSRLLVLGENLLKDPQNFKEVLDDIERKAGLSQQMRVVAFRGDPSEIFKVKAKLESLLSSYVTGIMDNAPVTSAVVNMTLKDLLSSIRNSDGEAAIPLLEVIENEKPEFQINSLVLVKDYKLLTYMDNKYSKVYKLMNKELERGRKLVKYKDLIIPFYIYTAEKKIWLEDKDDRLKYRVKIELEGDIEEFEFNRDIFDEKIIKDIEQAIKESTKSELDETTQYFQNEVGTDYLSFDEYTHKNHNKVYQKYKDNWDEAFKKADIEYDVEINIRRVGASKE
jgi:Ger(x)C family germination protein